MTTAARLYRRELRALRYIQDLMAKYPRTTNTIVCVECAAAFLLALCY